MAAMARAIGASIFARAMAALGPYEQKPEIAVAVSGGADSLALLLLIDRWVRARGGRAVALTVDHGLRPAARGEAAQVRRWCRARAIACHVLSWKGAKPKTGLQAAARRARYQLLIDACRTRAILHLALAHHAEDQAETLLLRLAHGSGLDGLAAMPAIAERDGLRLLRPLLRFPKARLRATLIALDQDWIEDPSNEDPRFERVRWRSQVGALAEQGFTPASLALAARLFQRGRAAGERAVAALLTQARAEGRGWSLPAATLAAVPLALRERALIRLLQAVGGGDYPPRGAALARLAAAIGQGERRGRTLGGCLLRWQGGRLRVLPETGQIRRPAGSRTAGSKPRYPLIPAFFPVV